MKPLIRPGDQVLVNCVRADHIGFGDIMLFRRDGELIVHRVLKKRHNALQVCFIEQGDARHVLGLVSSNMVIGRICAVRRGNKVFDLTSPQSRLTSAALTTWLYMASSAVNLVRRSGNRTVRRAGNVLSNLLLRLSNLMIRVCFAVWYPSGLFSRRDREIIPERLGR